MEGQGLEFEGPCERKLALDTKITYAVTIFYVCLFLFGCAIQITTLVSAPDRPLKAERSRRALGRVGRAVQAAVERFVLVGETIADDNSEIKLDMYEACREARQAGKTILFVQNYKLNV